MSMEILLAVVLAATALGYGLLRIVLFLLPSRLQQDDSKQCAEMLADARRQAESFRKSEAERSGESLQTLKEELEEELKDAKEDFEIANAELDNEEQMLQQEESRIQKLEADATARQEKVEVVRSEAISIKEQIEQVNGELIRGLEKTANQSADKLLENHKVNVIEDRQLEAQRMLKLLEEDLNTSAKRLADRMMARTLSRYYPDFYWPKMVNHAEIPSKRTLEELQDESCRLLADMKEIAEIEVDILAEHESAPPIIKLAGGAGINREAVRLALTELLKRGKSSWGQAASFYDKYRAKLEKEAISLGAKACYEVRLDGIHPEIQKLVGYLNWRTSYRQNQWHHTVEVAKLAGILAHEVQVDPDHAKRCGLLHDIGKALDYRIDGSHAVISGDYADRYGESRLVCDTVMSHHNDLIVETPLSYVLKAADTLSGARPGARVNLEEGYQVRLSGIEGAVRAFPGVISVAIMNGAREVHVEVNHKKVKDHDLASLSSSIAKKITEEVAFPGEIKVLVTRRFEATAVA